MFSFILHTPGENVLLDIISKILPIDYRLPVWGQFLEETFARKFWYEDHTSPGCQDSWEETNSLSLFTIQAPNRRHDRWLCILKNRISQNNIHIFLKPLQKLNLYVPCRNDEAQKTVLLEIVSPLAHISLTVNSLNSGGRVLWRNPP